MENTPTNGYTEGINESLPGRLINEIIYKEYEIKGKDNLLYIIRIFQEENSILFYSKIINNLDNIDNVIYKNELSLDNFHNLNNYFRQYLTCEEIFSIIFSNIKNANIYKENKNNIIKFGFLVGKENQEEEINILIYPIYPEKGIIENIIWN